MIGAWEPLTDDENDRAWDEFDARFRFVPTGGEARPAIEDPDPSITFDLEPLRAAGAPGLFRASWDSVEASARRAFLSAFGDDVALLVLDWNHNGYRLRPAEDVPPPIAPDGFPLLPSVLPDGDYYIHATPDLKEGTFAHPWEPSLCVFGPQMVRMLGAELRTWLPVLRERGAQAA
ncbi:DUF2716 domain-containing protein [Microbacterium oleivorans]|uniref:DUF2716 domain-containing protein n=1 Tax=Microbacterium oleivorans TaxID=273677 RepID=UPI0007673C9B|nr:DUF2716 domain-containing protein [Microbacterium oleivorans]